jgi:hypothetical protein
MHCGVSVELRLSGLRAQITASVTFLPLLSDPCTFDLLVYTDTSSDVPLEWCAAARPLPALHPGALCVCSMATIRVQGC